MPRPSGDADCPPNSHAESPSPKRVAREVGPGSLGEWGDSRTQGKSLAQGAADAGSTLSRVEAGEWTPLSLATWGFMAPCTESWEDTKDPRHWLGWKETCTELRAAGKASGSPSL